MTEPTNHDRPVGPGQDPGHRSYGSSPAPQPDDRAWHQGWDQPPLTELPPGAEPAGGWVPAQHGQPGHSDRTGGYPPAAYPGGGYPPAGYPNGGYPNGGYPNAGYPPGAYLPPGYPLAPQPRRRLRLVLASVAAVLLLVIGGVAAGAYEVLNGGGTQPDAVVPANAVAFVKLDLNPSAQQKIDAARFLHRLPKIGGGFTNTADWRKAIFQAFASDGSVPTGVDYDRDVKPWLGKRMAVATLPDSGSDTGRGLLVLQCTDEAKARVGIARFDPTSGVSFSKGYAIIAPSQSEADRAVADAKAADLADSDHYRSDMKRLDGLGVLSGWVDLAGALKLASPAVFGVSDTGRLAFTLRLRGNSADLIAKSVGGVATSDRPAESLADLPASTAAAASLSYNAAAIDAQWKQYSQLLGSATVPNPTLGGSDPLTAFADQFGLHLPEDLSTLLGTGVRASVDGDGLGGDTPKFAVHSTTDGAAAKRVLDRVQEAAGGSLPITYRADSTGLLVGSDPGYLAAVSARSGATLGGLPNYRDALPDAAGATIVAFVDFDTVRQALSTSGKNQNVLDHIQAFRSAGLTLRVEDGTPTFHVRLLAH